MAHKIANIVRDALSDENPEALYADDFDSAIIGIGRRCGKDSIVAYDVEKCIKIIMKKSDCSYEDAVDYFEFNVSGAWHGENTPIFIYKPI